MITLITGGIKSGKSSHALQIAQSFHKRAFLATTDPQDESMKEKIAIHQKERENLSMAVFEEKVNISPLLIEISSGHDVIILDCITMWISNIMFMHPEKTKRETLVNNFIETLNSLTTHCIIVTNETGMGIIPENKLAREFGQELGLINKQIAQIANCVIFMVSGIPLFVKNINNGDK